MDKLDLLGVRHDYEMELQARYDLAKTICDFWKDRSENFYDFKTNCICTICYELKIDKNNIEEIKTLWKDIVEYYVEQLGLNLKDIKGYDNHAIIQSDTWLEDIVFNDVYMTNYYSVIDMQRCGENIGARILNNSMKRKDIIIENDDFNEDFKDELLTLVEETITNKIRDEICNFTLEYINDTL